MLSSVHLCRNMLLMASLTGTLGATGAYLATAIIALASFLLAFIAVR